MLNRYQALWAQYSMWFSAVLVALLVSLPIWAGPYFPTQDGPVYLYNAWVFHSLHDPTNVLMQASFSANNVIYAFPNWCLAQLMTWLPPLIAEKWFYYMLVLSWITSVVILCRSCGVKHALVIFLAALWAFNEMLMLGMINFCLAQIPLILATALWLRYRSALLRLHVLPVVLFSLLAFAALLLHPFMALPLGMLLLMSLIERFIQLGTTDTTLPEQQATVPWLTRGLPWVTHGVVSIAWLTLWVAVLLVIVTVYHGASQEAIDVMPSSWIERWHFWLQAHSLGYFSETHTTVGILMMWVFIVLGLGRSIHAGLLGWHTRDEYTCRERLNALLINPLTLLTMTGMGLILIGFTLPWAINNVGFMYKRCFWLAWVYLLPILFHTLVGLIQAIPHRLSRLMVGVLVVCLPVGYVTSLTYQCVQLDAELDRIVTVIQSLPAHRRVDVSAADKYVSTRLGILSLVSPFYHLDSYIGLQRPDRVTSDTFGHGRFNLVWLNSPHIDDRTLDAVLMFRYPEQRKVHVSSAFYPSTFTSFDTLLFLKKPNAYRPQSTAYVVKAIKNHKPVILGCSPQPELSIQDTAPIVHLFPSLHSAVRATLTPRTFERDSGWGWLASKLGVLDDNRRSIGVQAAERSQPVKYPYTQWGREPAHILLPLPPGHYRVVWWSYSVRSIPVRLSLSANGRRVVSHLTLTPGAMNTIRYAITVGQEGLLQTVTGEDGSPWAMSGMAIIPD